MTRMGGWESGSGTKCYPHPVNNPTYTGDYLSIPYWTFVQLEAFQCATTMTEREYASMQACRVSLSMSIARSPLLRLVLLRRVHRFANATIHDSSRPPNANASWIGRVDMHPKKDLSPNGEVVCCLHPWNHSLACIPNTRTPSVLQPSITLKQGFFCDKPSLPCYR